MIGTVNLKIYYLLFFNYYAFNLNKNYNLENYLFSNLY